jgi:hypothetical protein
MSLAEGKSMDPYGKGGGLIDGELVREYPVPCTHKDRHAA